MKPKIAVFVLCSTERTGWVNPYLVSSLMCLQRDSRLDVKVGMVIDKRPVEHARNVCIVDARTKRADVCVQIDNDMTLPSNFADIVYDAFITKKAVVALASGVLLAEGPKMMPEDLGESDGNFLCVTSERAGSGVLIISSEVWRVIPTGPWFRWLVNEDETLSRYCSEDFYFCRTVQNNGLTVWTHKNDAGHLKTSDATRWTSRLVHLQNKVAASEDRDKPACVAW